MKNISDPNHNSRLASELTMLTVSEVGEREIKWNESKLHICMCSVSEIKLEGTQEITLGICSILGKFVGYLNIKLCISLLCYNV